MIPVSQMQIINHSSGILDVEKQKGSRSANRQPSNSSGKSHQKQPKTAEIHQKRLQNDRKSTLFSPLIQS
jgi:hypothetical protein